MTRWQKFGWALGYSALFFLTPLAYLFCGGNGLMMLPGSSVFTGVLFAGFSEIPALENVTIVTVLAMMTGLVMVPVCVAFWRYWPLYALMALDIALHALLIAHGMLEGDSTGTLKWLIPGFIVSIGALAVTVYVFCLPRNAEKSAATPCKSAAGDV